jgi:toxin ParE1/3/4
MAFRVDFTELAAADLEDISNFIAIDNPAAAARVCRQLYEAALSLGENPFLGRVTPEYKDETIRDLVRGNYRIVYIVHVNEERLEILRFWHGARGYLPRAD